MFYKKFARLFPIILLLFAFMSAFSQRDRKSNVFYLEGANSKSLFEYLECWKDSSDTSSLSNAANALKNDRFKSWKTTNPLYPCNSSKDLWVHLLVKNNSEIEKKYWLGIYTQSDTIYVYEKQLEKWFVVDTLDYSSPMNSRTIKTRFLATYLDFNTNSSKELLLQIKNKRHSSSIYFDITTGIDSMQWEANFYWKIGVIVGGFLIILLISLFTGFIVNKKIFFSYSIYLFIVIQILLQEELFIAVFPNSIFKIIYRFNSLPLSLIGVSLHFLTTFLLVKLMKVNIIFKEVLLTYYIGFALGFGILFSLIYSLFMENMGFNSYVYTLFWNSTYYLILLTIFLNGLFIFICFKKFNYSWLGGILSLFFLCFNPASYFLNYLGFIKLYNISSPIVFYVITFSETLFLGGFIAVFYRYTVENNYTLMIEKNLIYDNLLSNKLAHQKQVNAAIVETQEKVFENISQELHDNVGQQLTVVNFQIEKLKLDFPSFDNHLSPISFSLQKLSENLRQLSHSLNNNYLSEKGLIKAIFVEITRINESKSIVFNLIIDDKKKRKFNLNEQIIIFRIFQETINNIIKHAKATKVEINIITLPLFRLEIEDNGIGFDQNITNSIRPSIGLKNCFDRAKIIDFDFKMESVPLKGTKIILREVEKAEEILEEYTSKNRIQL